MKTISLSDRLNPVFVKEIRQSIHDRSLGVAAAILAAGQLFLWYLRGVLQITPLEQQNLAVPGFIGTFIVLLFLLIHFAMRSGRERNMEGFDPARGTGYPPWKIAMGKTAASWAILGGLMLLFLPGLFILSGDFHWRKLLTGMIFLFMTGQCSQYCYMFSESKSMRGLFMLYFCVQMLILGIGLLLAPLEEMPLMTYLLLNGAGILLGGTFFCGQITQDLPCYADRSMIFKIALFVFMLYLLLSFTISPAWWQEIDFGRATITGAVGGLYLLGALFERREPSRRQIRQAPRNIFLRILAFFFTSGTVPGLVTGTLLLAAALGMAGNVTMANFHGALISSFYILLGLYLSGKTRQPAITMWLAVLLLCNIPCISGVMFPLGTAFALASPEFLGPEIAVAIAGAAWLAGILLNGPLFIRFLRCYFRKEGK